MQKEIKYTGFSETPSDYECPDGDLATVVGMVPEDEAMKPIQQPTTLFKLPAASGEEESWSVVFIHKNTGFTHYIICHEQVIHGAQQHAIHEKAYYWIENFEPGHEFESREFTETNLIVNFQDKEIYELNALGKTLMFLADEGVHYCLWEGVPDNKYKSLGNILPETQLSFGLQGDLIGRKQTYYNVSDANYDPDDWNNRAGANRELHQPEWFSDTNMAMINKYIKEFHEDKNKFIYPFFVRYAYRLFDGSLAMFSAPILMVTDASAFTPRAPIHRPLHGSDTFDCTVEINFLAYDLDYMANIPSDLSRWSDIIKSVDIFVSAPIYTYDQSGKITAYHNAQTDEYTDEDNVTEKFNGYTVGHIGSTDARYADDESIHYTPDIPAYDNEHYMKQDSSMYRAMYNSADPAIANLYRDWVVPHFNKEKITKDVKDCHTFYLIKSIPIEELAQERTKIELESGCLSTLLVKEVMTDEAIATNNFIAKTSFAYNQRMNFANMSYKLRNPAPAQACTPYTDDTPQVQYDIYVYERDEMKEVVVKSDDVLNFQEDKDPFATDNPYNPFIYFYYANPNATKVVIKKHVVTRDADTADNSGFVFELKLEKHDFLNGAVFFNGWFPTVTASTEYPVPSEDTLIEMPNKLYTSEVGNPFVFTSRGIQTVGVGTILGVRPIVKAMSLAQYGQHDLYVFSTDGVWSLEVDSEGYMQHPHLATPDIVLGNGGSISQIDGGVLFATDRGIMLISGSDSICISDMLNSSTPFCPIGATAAQDLLPGLRNVAGELLEEIQMVTFRNFITDCRMTYDYPHQRIIIYSPSQDYAYVYSLKSKQWGMMPSKIQSTPLNYPAALAMVSGEDNKNVLVDYSKDDIVEGVTRVESGLIITRPLKLDYPDVLKTVDTVIQRGKFQTGHVKSILYGSRDLYNWQLVWSSVDQYLRGFSGTPYKYFCLALICDMEEGEDLTGCTVQFTPRLTDQLR